MSTRLDPFLYSHHHSPEFIELGYPLFRDKETSRIRFLTGNIFDTDFLDPTHSPPASPPSLALAEPCPDECVVLAGTPDERVIIVGDTHGMNHSLQ